MSTLTLGPLAQRRELAPLLRSVVKVLCVSDSPNYEQPWQTRGPISSFGSGCIITTARGTRVLTNAHCVVNSVFVEVRRYGNAQKYVAEVEAIGQACDLALLRIDDPSFYHGTTAIEIGSLPKLSDRVSVCGYPIGGDRISITEGIVSRIELVSYAQSNRSLLAVQIDAAINSGNSGGPVVKNGRLAGVAFQALDEAETIGYMIAPPVVEHFLRDVELCHASAGDYEGFPDLGISTQPLESRAHRRALGLGRAGSPHPGGVLVSRVSHGGSADGVVRPGDVLLEVDGVEVASDGTVPLREGELIEYGYVVSSRHIGERLRITLFRNRQELRASVELKRPTYLVAEERHDVRPQYFVVGGLLFVPLTRDYLKTWGDSWWNNAPRELVTLYEHGLQTNERHEAVVMQKVLADRVNQGYHDLESVLIEQVDGVPVRSLTHLVELVEASDCDFLRFRLVDGREIVLDRLQALERHEDILRKFGVPFDRSIDLRRAARAIPSSPSPIEPPASELFETRMVAGG